MCPALSTCSRRALSYASLAPSFVANYPGATIATMEKALKQLGFAGVEETAIGASIVKTEYENIVREGRQEVIISTCCHSVNTLVEKYYPEALPYLATVLSPPCRPTARKSSREHPEVKTIFIGPCISKKAEAEAYPGLVDCVLTFEELSDWLKQEGITIEQGEDHLEESRAPAVPHLRRYPAHHELRFPPSTPTWWWMASTTSLAALEDIKEGRLKKCFIEMSICAGSCIGGPAMERERRRPITDTIGGEPLRRPQGLPGGPARRQGFD